MYDPDTYMFINDDEILAREGFSRRLHCLERESDQPTLLRTGANNDEPVGCTTVAKDIQTTQLKAWVCSQATGQVRITVSDDMGMSWARTEPVEMNVQNKGVNCIGLMANPPGAEGWFADSDYSGFCMFGQAPNPFGNTIKSALSPGIYLARCSDGKNIEAQLPAALPHKGDRSSICYDQTKREYHIYTRPFYGYIPGFKPIDFMEVVKHRMVNLWTSSNLVDWKDRGIVLRYNDSDPPGAQIYGLIPFRYGRMFLGFAELYYPDIQKLDTQLAWSRDGLNWQRLEPGSAVLSLGTEGTWDSHWVVPTNNAPFVHNERLMIPYIGAGTKHGSGQKHKRSLGIASLRRDGWASLQAGEEEAKLVTKELPLDRPMKLELNVDCRGGYVAAEIIPAVAGQEFTPLPGYDDRSSRLENIDSVCKRVAWGGRRTVEPIPAGKCFLVIKAGRASLFSFKWTSAD